MTDVSGPGPVRCNATLSVEPPSIPAGGGPATIAISAARDCTWTARSEVSWLQLGATTGQGESTVGVTAIGNPQAGARSGAILVNDQRLSITQDGRGCAITLSTPTDPVAYTGGRRTLAVTTLAGCPWTVTSSAPWLLPLAASGSGAGNVAYDIQPNSGSAREGSLTVGTAQVVISQTAAPVAPPCTFTIDRPGQDFTAAGGQTTVAVSTQADCGWTVTGGASWLTVQVSSGSGSGAAAYSVQPNASLSARSTTLTIAGRVHTVTQQGVQCTFTLNPTSGSFPAGGGSSSVQVTTLPICPWTASSNAAWVTVGTAGGTGSGSVPFTVQPNLGTSSRTALLTIGGLTFQVQQNGAPACTYDLTPPSQTAAATASSYSVQVTTQPGCAWTATTSDPWITVAPGSGAGSGTATVGYAVAANPGTTSRTGSLTIGGRQHVVTQQGAAPVCTYALDPLTATLAAGAGTSSVQVTTQAGCAWTATSSASWLTITNPAGSGTAAVSYAVAVNVTTAARTAVVTVAGIQHQVTQQAGAAPCTYSISPAELSFPTSGGTGTITLTTGATCGWTAVPSAGWISITNPTGTGSASIVYQVPPNGNRVGTITVGGQVHTIRQGNP